VDENKIEPRAVGVQSSWFPESRIISFCPVGEFLDALVKAVANLSQEHFQESTTKGT
jgi:hypothetical protein